MMMRMVTMMSVAVVAVSFPDFLSNFFSLLFSAFYHGIKGMDKREWGVGVFGRDFECDCVSE